MKIAYFGGDWFLTCISVLQHHGHNISHIFTHGEQSYNKTIRHWAEQEAITVNTNKPTVGDLQNLQNQGVDCLFCIEYPWLIPVDGFNFRTINVHPSLLPEGKGPTPLSWILMKYPQFAGISFHKMITEFDGGDIIYQQPLQISDHDSLDTVLARLELETPRLLNILCDQFETFYQAATPQGKGSYWPKITLDDRKLNWQSNCSEIKSRVSAAGHFGVVAAIEDSLYLVTDVQCVQHQHQLQPGTVFKDDPNCYSIAISDGICVLSKASIIEKVALTK